MSTGSRGRKRDGEHTQPGPVIADKPLELELKITGASSLVMSMEQIATELEGQASLPFSVLRDKMNAAAKRLRQAVSEWREEQRAARKEPCEHVWDGTVLADLCAKCGVVQRQHCEHMSIFEGTCEDCGLRGLNQ